MSDVPVNGDRARYYSMRRLSPYQGTVQVIDIPGFRAMSADGERWRVQFLNPRSRFASHGIWRRDGGGTLIDTPRTHAILEALQAHPPLPFALADTLELWLLDASDGMPLALLASTLPERSPGRVPHARWQAALAGDPSFIAASLSGAGASAIAHESVLMRCVQKAAGPRPSAQWFRRGSDGAGDGLAAPGSANPARRIGADRFPELLLRHDWPSEAESALVRDYHDWHAPSLLTHTNLKHTTRDRLERAACKQAARLYRVRHLLPEMLNPELLKVAFVEAVVRRSA